ncbi:hypothetical protein N7513_003297 [Penicillium frequentans]|nr:hypothetical protein N7513_003297 [Penicillium glabrum]
MVNGDLDVFRNVCNITNSPPPDYATSIFKQTEHVDLPPYPQSEVHVSDQGGKRRRGSSSSIDGTRKRPFRPPESPDLQSGSLTEVYIERNTQSTLSPSLASIRPTDFERTSPGCCQDGKLAHLIEALRDATDETIIKALEQTNHSDLLASRRDI